MDHERKVIFFKKGLSGSQPFFVLLDTFIPKDGKEHLYEVHFQLGTEPTTETEKSITADHGDGVTLTLLSSGEKSVECAQYEPRYTGWKKKFAPGAEHEHYPAPAVFFSARGGVAYVATVAYPAKDAACPIVSVACDKETFSLGVADGMTYTFDKNDPAFRTFSTVERLEKGMDICMDID